MSEKNILITNDDGIDSNGLARLAEVAKNFGKVWVIAPDGQRSATSHKIAIREPIDIYKVDFPVDGVEAYKMTGTPADCVRIGVPNIVKGKTDIVLSGINYGYNSGLDIQYSGTVGAAMEAASMGIHAIALSEAANEMHEVTDFYLSPVLSSMINYKLGFNQIWNVNFPGCTMSGFRGILPERKVADIGLFIDKYVEEKLSDGGTRVTISNECVKDAPDGTDLRALLDGYISISRLMNISNR
ncbi:5'-nucleotidase /3'-nucleotidase /exopolyphosphatase [Lachnospiraceae bacterium KH1T2]|nr:5'-nucleotidase /3'-nucleotidase /exopolyphosphatase [Lachnospiraceae bacterium KH1T2]